MSAQAKRVERNRLYRAVKKNPRLINKRSFIKRASLVNFRLPITVRLRESSAATNPNTAKLDLGPSLGKRAIGLGGSLSGEIVFHDSYDGGALGNVDVQLNPGNKTLTTTSVPLLWNTNVTDPTTSVKPTFKLAAGTAGCGDFHGATSVANVPWWATQGDYDASNPSGGTVPDTPGVDDPARLVASAAVGSDDNLGPNPNPFPYTAQSVPGGFTQPPGPGDSVLRTTPLSLGIASAGTEVNQTDGSANGPQGSQNVVIGKSGGQANLFGNIPGKSNGIDITVNLATRINSILRSMDPDYVPLIASNPWPTTWSACRQAYSGAVQNYITGVHLVGSLHISPAITSDGALRIAKATLTTPATDPARIALAACVYPYSLYTAERNNSDTVSQTVSSYTSGGQLPTNEFVARKAPNVDCGATPTKLVQDAPTLNLNPASPGDGYTTSVDGKRVSVSGDLLVDKVSADILVGDRDTPPATPALSNDYVALGDSIAYGYQSALFQTTPNPAVFNFGYVDLFGAYLQKTNPSLAYRNYGCPGETSTSLINGLNPSASLCGKGSGFPYALLHVNYGAGNTQLDAAKGYLLANPGTLPAAPVVTLDVGANDVLDFLSACGFPAPAANTCISNGLSAKFAQITANVNTIITQLQAAAPNARYIVMGLYNPYPTLLNVGGFTGDKATALLNSQLKQVAANHGARFVDPLPVFNPSISTGGSETGDVGTICALTGMCPAGVFNPGDPAADIHPSRKGYAALASLFESASGF